MFELSLPLAEMLGYDKIQPSTVTIELRILLFLFLVGNDDQATGNRARVAVLGTRRQPIVQGGSVIEHEYMLNVRVADYLSVLH